MDPSKLPNPQNMLALQAQVRHNSAEIQDYFSDLMKWEEEAKKKDKAISKGDLNPVRGKASQIPKVRQKGFAEMVPSGMPGPKDRDGWGAKNKGGQGDEESRIRPKNYQDYNQWDKFVHKDLDKILDDFDENDRQEQEETHRNRLAEERKKIEEKERQARAHMDEAERLKGLGNDLLKAGDLEGAKAMYGRAIETDPRNHIPFANRALVLLKQERYSEAVEDCDQCLKIDPRFVKALLRRATAYTSLGEKEKATADLKKALMLEPGNKQAKDDLATLAMTPEEVAAKEKEKQEALAREEKERRRRERGGKKLIVREAEEKPSVSAADADTRTRKTANTTASDTLSTPPPVTAAEAAPPAKNFVSVADAREIARQAKEAVEAKMSADGIQVPSNSIEFERGWKRVKGSKDKYLEYLAAIPLDRIPSYFKGDIDDDVLSAILQFVDDRLLPSRADDAAGLLEGMKSVPRLGIAVKLMSRKDRELLDQILVKLGDAPVCESYTSMLAK